jgi:hypothetical protein
MKNQECSQECNYLNQVSDTKYSLYDHGCGFDKNLHNESLDKIQDSKEVLLAYVVNDQIRNNYKHLHFQFDFNYAAWCLNNFPDIKSSQQKTFKNFISSFNGVKHDSRQLLVSALQKFNYFDPKFNTKNFVTSSQEIDGLICDYLENDQERLYRKFILADDEFYSSIYSKKYLDYMNDTYGKKFIGHCAKVLAPCVFFSFLHIVSETMGTSYYPFVSEKILYPVAFKNLWVGYAQPNWHHYVEKHYGFKLYHKVFDYKFDNIQNPIHRLLEMMFMVSKFEKLTNHEWHDLYLLEQDTIDYNYDWYMSRQYQKHLECFT